MSFNGIASIDKLFSTDDLHLIYSPQHAIIVPVTATVSPTVRQQTVSLHHVLIQSIRKGYAALSAWMVRLFQNLKENFAMSVRLIKLLCNCLCSHILMASTHSLNGGHNCVWSLVMMLYVISSYNSFNNRWGGSDAGPCATLVSAPEIR